jgi:23S rRNA (guanine745-N1)-methyltransferase
MLTCPVCVRPLTRAGHAFRCPLGHSFDVAREGYVNLLRDPYPGDTRAMAQARRAFLDAGHYAPLADAIARQVAHHITQRAPNAPLSVLDAGCGEGSYIADVAARLHSDAVSCACYGLDVSKEAIRMAAQRYRQVTFIVANLKARIPFADGSVSALMNVFAPRNPAEFARVLAPGGLLLVVLPTPRHLAEARAAFALLDIQPEKERLVCESCAEHFMLAGSEPLDYSLTLDGQSLAALIAMTPNARHVSAETLERARQAAAFTVTASFAFLRFLRR